MVVAITGPTTSGYVERLAGNVLRIARARAGLSQRELAAAAHVPQSTIARIESGTRQPSLPVLARILAAVDLELRIDVADYDAPTTFSTPTSRGCRHHSVSTGA